jgi:hypothetical protein
MHIALAVGKFAITHPTTTAMVVQFAMPPVLSRTHQNVGFGTRKFSLNPQQSAATKDFLGFAGQAMQKHGPTLVSIGLTFIKQSNILNPQTIERLQVIAGQKKGNSADALTGLANSLLADSTLAKRLIQDKYPELAAQIAQFFGTSLSRLSEVGAKPHGLRFPTIATPVYQPSVAR